MNDYYARFIGRGDKIAVAVSGGSDSVALLHFLLHKSEKDGFSVSAVNVEHGIRGDRSRRDSAFVKELCEKWGVPLFAFSADAPARAAREKISLEHAAREERYDVFCRLLAEKKADKIATAHHLGDNAETVLFHLLRGASLKGAAGIPPSRDGIIRPFLTTPKAEITDYIRLHNLPYVEDETNEDRKITRNFIRAEVLPRLKEKFPEGERALLRFCEIAREEDAFLDDLASPLTKEEGGAYRIPASAPRVLLRRAALSAMKRLGIRSEYAFAHVESVAALADGGTGARVDLPDGVAAEREYGDIVLFPAREKPFFEAPFAAGVYRCGAGTLTVEPCAVDIARARCGGEGAFYADADKLSGTLIRTRREGDVFRKFGGGSKKLKDYYIDEKIPRRLRDEMLLIARGKEILFAGTEISRDAKLDERTERAVKITYETQRRR